MDLYLEKIGLENCCTLEVYYNATKYVQLYVESERLYYSFKEPLGLSILIGHPGYEEVTIKVLPSVTKYFTMLYIYENQNEFEIFETHEGDLLLFKAKNSDDWDDWDEL